MDYLRQSIQSLIAATDFDCDPFGFDELALEIFHFQREMNPILERYWGNIKPRSIWDIPPVPSETLRFVKLYGGEHEPQFFESSSTSSELGVKHYYSDETLYRTQVQKYFGEVFGSVMIKSLLKARSHWSLYRMVEYLQVLPGSNEVCLLGTSKDLSESLSQVHHHEKIDKIFDTGGFKNFISEMDPEEFYEALCETYGLRPEQIISEYGMTELFSQAYDQTFELNPQKRVKRSVPTLKVNDWRGSGRMQVVDLCNLESCAFLLTGDRAKVISEREFILLDRFDVGSLRGCSLR